jgi:hypothetical protein
MSIKEDDIKLLPPTMQLKVQAVLDGMVALGYEPVLFDGIRTKAEAARNAVVGKGIVDSIHCYGAAADIICRKHLWQCKPKGCKFYVALGKLAKGMGFVWGGDFHSVDQPHIQAVMVFMQDQFRALEPDLRDAQIQKFFLLRELAKLIAGGDLSSLPEFQKLYGTQADGVYGPISKSAVKRFLAVY